VPYHPRVKNCLKKAISFVFFTCVTVGMVFPSLWALLRTTEHFEYYSHIILVPVVSAFFLVWKKKTIFGQPGPLFPPGLLAMAGGLALFFWGRGHFSGPDDTASITVFSALVFWGGAFLFTFGRSALQKAAFPIAFLLFAVPLPAVAMEKIISALVTVSVVVSGFLFKVVGVHFAREGSFFRLPGFNIEIGRECSGIRSSLSLLIVSVLAGHLFLRKFWKKVVLAILVFPIAVFKNGLRIVSLYLLSYYVDTRFIEGNFHHKFAGSVFFLIGLLMLGLVLWIFRRSERD
jgi:exosortase